MSRPWSTRLLVSYALAWAGGCVAYTPFLTILLPLRFTALTGGRDVHWLGLCATVGAVAASSASIGWGWLTDRTGHRLLWSIAGLAATGAALVAVARSDSAITLVAAVACWQVCLNLFLAPLGAFAADHLPHAQKGTLGGLLSLGPGIAALSIVGVSLAPPDLSHQLGLVLLFVLAAAAPLMVLAGERWFPFTTQVGDAPPRGGRGALIQLWAARLLVQVAEGLLFVFLFYFLRSLSGGELSLGSYAATNASAQLCSIPVAIMVGRASDRRGRRRAPLLAMIALLAVGLATMALAHSWNAAVLGYGIFLTGSNSFLALHATFAMQQLLNPRRHGRDLGLMNLTNTLPALITPMLAVLVIGRFGYSGLLLGLTFVMAIPAVLIARLDIA